MSVLTSLAPTSNIELARVDLAAAFRWLARLGMHEGVANHLSLTVSADGSKFLMNPRGRHFRRIRASDLLLLDAHDPDTMSGANAPDPTAWVIHGRLHALLPQACCVMHLHPKHATALAALDDSSIYPVDQNTMRFYDRMVIDDAYGGMALCEEEGERLARLIGDKRVMMMCNHGILVVGPTVAQALDEMCYVERAAETLITCYATGRKLRVAADNVARLTAQQWADYSNLADDHLAEAKAILDREEPDYRD